MHRGFPPEYTMHGPHLVSDVSIAWYVSNISFSVVSNSYTTVRPSEVGDNPQALSPVQVDFSSV